MPTDDPPITPVLARALPHPLDTSPRGDARPRRREADVVVVGAGLAGLAAADRLTAAGLKTIVLEARSERVGGRLETGLHGGHAVDLGGAWIGARHERAAALAQRLGLSTWRTHSDGAPVVIADGQRRRGRVYKLRHAAATLDARRAARRLDSLAGAVSVQAPWASAAAGELDAQTLDSWLESTARLGRSRATLRGTLTNLLGIEPRQVSLLHALFYLRSGGGIHAMLGQEDGAQQTLVAGGAHGLAAGLAAQLDVELGQPVRRIEHGDGRVRVTASDLTVEAGAVIVALSPPLAGRIEYAPALPVERERLTAAMPQGDVTKVVAVYPDAFWRREGLSGEAWGEDLPFSFSYDMSEPDGAPGVLTMFFAGDRAQRLRALSAASRRARLTAALECCFGPRAAAPTALLSRDWAADPWSRGAYGAYMPPGVWTTHGRALRAPTGPIAWAGAETAAGHTGYMEGALESGERAAAETLVRLRPRQRVAAATRTPAPAPARRAS